RPGTVYFLLNAFRISLVLDDTVTLHGSKQFVRDIQFAIACAGHLSLGCLRSAGKAVDATGSADQRFDGISVAAKMDFSGAAHFSFNDVAFQIEIHHSVSGNGECDVRSCE